MLTCQILEGLEAILDKNQPVISIGDNRRIIDNCIRTPLFEGLHGKLVTIKRLAFQCEEDTPLRTVTAVGRDTRMLLVKFIKRFNFHDNLQFWCKDTKKMINDK